MSVKSKSKYTKELLEKHVPKSDSLSNLVRSINKCDKVHGSMLAYIKSKLNEHGIDYSHFTGRTRPSGGKENSKEDIEKYYLSKTPEKRTNNTNLKRWLFKFGILQEKCSAEGCVVGTIWNGEAIALQLDHIDGDNSNNEITNLRILCPNCHSQTDTYAGKKNK